MATKRALEDSFNVVADLVDFSGMVQGLISAFAIACSITLYWIVFKYTPKEMHSRRAYVLMQLNGFTHHSLILLLFGPFALFTHRIMMFSGPLEGIGSQWTPFVIGAWCANMTASANAVLTGAFVNYLALTDGIRQRKGFTEWFSALSSRKRIFLGVLFNFTIAWIVFAAVFFSLEEDISSTSADPFVDILQEHYSAVALGENSIATHVQISVFTALLVYFCVCSVYIHNIAKTDLEELKPTLSEKTYEMMSHMTRLLFLMALVPLFFLFVPGGLFIGLNIVAPFFAENDSSLLTCTLVIEGLLIFYPVSGHILILLCFRHYRDALMDVLCCRARNATTASTAMRPSSAAVTPEAPKRSRVTSAGTANQLVKALP